MKQSIAYILTLFLTAIPGSYWSAPQDIHEINFGQAEVGGKFITMRELEIWAGNRNLALIPDAPTRDLQDYEAEIIPTTGLKFSLKTSKIGRMFLYLDLVCFQPVTTTNPPATWLEIFVNGVALKIIYTGGRKKCPSPVVIPIDREHAPRKEFNIRLQPPPTDHLFAIWDAFISPSLEQKL